MSDTLTFAQALRKAGFEQTQAEAIAHGVAEFTQTLSATKGDLAELRAELKADIAELQADIRALEARLTVRLGGLIVAGVIVLGALIKL